MRNVLVNLDGRQVNVTVESGGLGAAASVNMAAIAADVVRAESAASDAAASALEAETAVAGVPAAIAGKLDRDGSNVGGNAAALRTAIGAAGSAALAASTGATLVGSNDGAGGTLWTTIGGLVSRLLSSAGSTVIGWIQAGTGAVSRSVQSKLRDVVSPEDFGAVGDGVTNDGPAFQLAFDHINAQGGGTVVLVPGKNYFLDQQINLCNDLCLWGYGAKITVGSGFAKLERPLFKNFSGSQFNTPGTVLADRNLSFFGFEVDGDSVGIPAALIPNADMRGVIIGIGGWDNGSGADGVVIRDCNMHDFAGPGVMLWYCTNVDISNNKFKNFFANVSLSVGSAIDFHAVSGGTVSGNKISHDSTGLSWHGMVLLDWDGGPSENLVVSGNVITNMNGGDGISCEGNGGAGSNGRNLLISENVILDCEGQGIGVDFCISVKVVNNVIRRVIGPGILATSTLELEAIGNTIEDSGLGGIYSVSGTVTARIIDNNISNIRYEDGFYRGMGVEIRDDSLTAGRLFTITGNRIADVDGCGVFAYSANGEINNNIVYNAGRSASNTDVLRMGIRSNVGMSVRNNYVVSSGTTRYGIGTGSGDLFDLSGNTFAGTFTLGWYHIGFRGTGINHNLALNIIEAVYDSGSNTLIGRFNGVPAGYFYQGDTLYETQPAAAGFIGQVVTTTGASPTWKTFGAITA